MIGNPSPNDVIRFDDVSRSFGNQIALDRVSYSVPSGVVFALLGENGAGKTTSIKSILGMCQPDAGRVSVLGMHPMANGLDIRRQVGYVPEPRMANPTSLVTPRWSIRCMSMT